MSTRDFRPSRRPQADSHSVSPVFLLLSSPESVWNSKQESERWRSKSCFPTNEGQTAERGVRLAAGRLLTGTAAPARAGHPHSGGTSERDARSLRAGRLQGPNAERGPVRSLLFPKLTSQAAQASGEQRARGMARGRGQEDHRGRNAPTGTRRRSRRTLPRE